METQVSEAVSTLEFLTRTFNVFHDNNLPELLVVEILIRLPAKSIHRFKLVSKQWLSIISDPYFFSRFKDFSSSLSSRPWTIIYRRMIDKGSKYSYFPSHGHLLDDIHCQVLKPTLSKLPLTYNQKPPNGEEGFEVIGISNGLVLYCLDRQFYSLFSSGPPYYRTFHICNPLTGQWLSLPPFNSHFIEFGCGFLTRVEDYALKSYIVVRVDMVKRLFFHGVRFEVFSSEIGEWRSYSVVLHGLEIRMGMQKVAIPLNGILHWVGKDHGIYAYDPYRDPNMLRIIAFPGGRSNRDGLTNMCAEYQGKLRFIEVTTSDNYVLPRLRVWILEDYDSGYWCLQYETRYMEFVQGHDNLPSEGSFFTPICFHPFVSEIVYLTCCNDLFSFNIKTKEVGVQRKFFPSYGNIYEWWWAFLFVIPPWPVSIHGPAFGVK